MLESIKRTWFGSSPVEFESAFGLEESVQRLKTVTKRWAIFAPKEVAAGAVTPSRVSLQRVIPMVGNSFKPFFIGRFEQRGAKVFLVGRFAMHRFVKLFMGVWVGGVVFSTMAGALSQHQPKDATPLLVGVGILFFFTVLTSLGGWFSRNDPAWLSQVIRNALHTPAADPTAGKNDAAWSLPRTSGRPWALIKMTLLMAIAGVALCISAITNVQSYYGTPERSLITHYGDVRLRYVSVLLGMVFLALSFAIYRRRLMGWRLVFWVIGAEAIMQLSRLLTLGRSAVPVPVIGVFCAFTLIFLVVWGRWWYAQREHFHE